MTATATIERATPKTKEPRYFPHTCTSCTQVDSIDRALLAKCPTCQTPPGAPCIDMRAKNKGDAVPLVKMHPARVTALNAL